MRTLALLLCAALSSGCELPSSGGAEPVPAIPYCESVSAWPSGDLDFEEDVLALVNERRAQGATCGGENVAATGPLEFDGSLSCAARKHSQDMVERDYFAHTNLDDQGPGDRANMAGFESGFIGENIAAGQQTPDAVMESWMNSSGHCSNIMNPNYSVIGIGHTQSHWTQVFGKL